MLSNHLISSGLRCKKQITFSTLVILLCVVGWLLYLRKGENCIYSISNAGDSVELGVEYDANALSKGLKNEISYSMSEGCSNFFRGNKIFAHIIRDQDVHKSFFISDNSIFGYHTFNFLDNNEDSFLFEIEGDSFMTPYLKENVTQYESSGVICIVKCKGADHGIKFFDATFLIKKYLPEDYENNPCFIEYFL